MNCGECGAPLPPFHGDRVVCLSCGMGTELRPRPLAKAEPRAHVVPNRVLAAAETRMRGELSLAHALDTVRPTPELLHRAYEHLRKHGIAWR